MEELPPLLVEHERVRSVDLGGRDEQLLGNRGRQVPPVELVHSGRELRSLREPVGEPVALAPPARAQEEAALARKSSTEAACRQHIRLVERPAEPNVAGGPHECVRQPPRIEAATDGPRVPRRPLRYLRAERLEPVESLVQLVDQASLQHGIAAGTLFPELGQRPMSPDHPARQQHRPAVAIALLEDDDLRAELPSSSRRDETGHARAGDPEDGRAQSRRVQRSENDALCSTYSSLTRSGPQTKSASVFSASTTLSISIPRSSASAMCSSTESTRTPM